MEVNLSGTSIGDPAVIDFIADSVRSAGIDPTALIFEVTETEAIVNIDRARVLSRQLSSLGCKFALDDFGAGFGSFYYLKHLPFDVVKIDGDFIKSLPTSTSDQLTVQAIVTIARGLQEAHGRRVRRQRAARSTCCASYGVDFAQGYHVGKPRRRRSGPRRCAGLPRRVAVLSCRSRGRGGRGSAARARGDLRCGRPRRGG